MEAMEQQNPMIPIERACREYGLAKAAVSTAVSREEVEGYQVGRQRLVNRASLEAWIKTHRVRKTAKKEEAAHGA